MKDLIEALTIFAKYTKEYAPTHCEHDVFIVHYVGEDVPTEDERKRLDELGFLWMDEYDGWGSFRFGSS